MDESTLILGTSGVFFILFHFSMKIKIANRMAPYGTPRFASHLGLFCLPMFHKKDARLIWVKGLSELAMYGINRARIFYTCKRACICAESGVLRP